MKTQIANLVQRFNGKDLKAQCARSSVVLTGGTVVEKGLAFLSKIILVRLLLPEEIGLMVLIVSLTAFFETLTEVGIKQSVIQDKKGAEPEYLNTAWWFQCLRGLGLYVLAFVATPWLCRFYFANKPEILDLHNWQELYILVRIAFLSILLNSCISPRAHVLEKEFRFGKSMLLMQGSGILGTIVTIILAFKLQNAWAMVIGFVSMTFLRCVFSFILCPFRPQLRFDNESFRSLFKFASGVFGSPILAYFAFNLDVLVGGKIVAPKYLGMYGMAISLAWMPREFFSRIVGPVLLPAFSKKQDDKVSISDAVCQITKFTSLLATPIMVLAIIYSEKLLSFIFGSEFKLVAVSFSCLCICVLFLVQGITLASVFLAIGQPAKHRAFVGLRFLILIILIYPAVRTYGMTGAATAVLFSNFIALGVQVAILHRVIGLDVRSYINSWLLGLVPSIPILVLARIFVEP